MKGKESLSLGNMYIFKKKRSGGSQMHTDYYRLIQITVLKQQRFNAFFIWIYFRTEQQIEKDFENARLEVIYWFSY